MFLIILLIEIVGYTQMTEAIVTMEIVLHFCFLTVKISYQNMAFARNMHCRYNT